MLYIWGNGDTYDYDDEDDDDDDDNDDDDDGEQWTIAELAQLVACMPR